MKLIIISNRLPIKIIQENDEYKVVPSSGGLTTGLDSLQTHYEKHWIGWPGMHLKEGEEKEKINKQMEEQHFHPVYLTPEQIVNYYEGYSNSVLWPLSHYFTSYVRYKSKYWDAYKEVNTLFCEKALEILEPGDIVWIQDYHLMLLPQMIRNHIPDMNIGYFHHIPFPSYELFRMLPERAEILKGLLGADLVGFHTHHYMRHFISAVYRVLKLDCVLDEIYLNGRVVSVNAFPMGINYDLYHDAILNPKINKNAKKLKKDFGNHKLILCVDRLDYSKGILLHLKSVRNFLDKHPEYQGKVSLVMVVAPSRDQVMMYFDLKNRIDKVVGSINGKYSTAEWRPVHYFYRNFNFEELIALYHISDIALVTPLRDGMNLVAKEYVAAKRRKPGVLILSEMAGAASELSETLIVNPTDIKEIEDALLKALEMPEEQQMKLLASMQLTVSSQTVNQWAEDFVQELNGVKHKNDWLKQKIATGKNYDRIKQAYDHAEKRLIVLDYDGTLVPFSENPRLAAPSPELLILLARLSTHSKNHLIVSSGRDRHTLEQWLGHLSVGLSAEHGAFYKENGEWISRMKKIKWDDEILNIIEQTVHRTPHSQIEIKDTAVVWHYRKVDPWLAELRVTQLINALMIPCTRLNLQVMKGNKIIEVKDKSIHKGVEVKRLIEQKHYDFVMAIGDDTTDEDMFHVLPQDAFTIKVGKDSTAARFNLPTQQLAVDFLDSLTN